MNDNAVISDSELLLEYLNAKDNKAYRHLYEVYYPGLKHLAEVYVKDENAAADMVQDVFISLLESTYRFSRMDEVRFFLYKALKNKCISHFRKEKVRSRYRQEVVKAEDLPEDFWAKVLEEDVYATLFAAVRSLPPQCRRVMFLSLDGLKISEIAEQLQISEDTVKEHRKNGKQKLARLLNSPVVLFLLSVI